MADAVDSSNLVSSGQRIAAAQPTAPTTILKSPRGTLPSGRPLRVLAELNGVPKRLLQPAAEWDERHAKITQRAIVAYELVGRDGGGNVHGSLESGVEDVNSPRSGFGGFVQRLRDVQRNKFIVPVQLEEVRRYVPKAPREVVAKVWKIEESVWQKRAGWADSGSYLDTVETYEKAFNKDWSMALRAHGLAKYIQKHDDGESDDEADEDGDGFADDELVEVGNVLWKHHALIYRAFDAYSSASMGSLTRISQNGFKQFCSDCHIAVKNSATCAQAHIDQMFLLVNLGERPERPERSERRGSVTRKASEQLVPDAVAPDGSGDGPSPPTAALGGVRGSAATEVITDSDQRALNRCEWLQCLVRLAIMKYVLPRKVPDVSTALDHLFITDIEGNMPESALQDSNQFRVEACYTEATDAALLARGASLRAVFDVYAKIDGNDIAHAHLARLLSSEEWLSLLRDLDWIDDEFTLREATLAFSWARMRVIDETSPGAQKKLENLCFEDFLDALVRVATMKALPTDEELAAQGHADAGAFFLQLRQSAEVRNRWQREHARRFDEPLDQPIERAVHHLLSALVRTIQAVSSMRGGSKKAAEGGAPSPPDVTKEEVQRFLKAGGAKAIGN